MSAWWELADLATPWSVHVVVTLRVAEHIKGGAKRIDDIARLCGAHAESLHRVLRHLAAKGLFEETAPGEFALNDAARELLDPGAFYGCNLDGFGSRMAGAWAGLLESVRTGRPAYHKIFGLPYWDDLAAHPEIAADFDQLMSTPGHGTPDADVLPSGDWDQVRTVVDAGGGTGALLAEVLRAHPHVRGI